MTDETDKENIGRRLEGLEQAVREIRIRNERVESDKAWEVSITRRISISILTYLVTFGVFGTLGVSAPARSALIPTVGYLLSTLTLPLIREYWRNAGRS